jgi:glycosyltransferase involved in cell wall biosynthesis
VISVIVPVFNSSAFLERVIDSLLRQSGIMAAPELIFIDNGSRDGSLELLKRYPQATVLQEPERGSYAARNQGLERARGDIVAFTDSDCYPVPGWLAAIERGFRDPEAQLLLGPRRSVGVSRGARLLAEYDNRKMEMICGMDDPTPYYGYTNNMAVRSETMARYGPFDFRQRGADTLLLHRVLAGEGCRAVCWNPGMVVEHAELDSVASYYRKARIYGESHRAFDADGSIRPLSARERIEAYRRAVSPRQPLDAAWLFALLVGGSLAWRRGGGRL